MWVINESGIQVVIQRQSNLWRVNTIRTTELELFWNQSNQHTGEVDCTRIQIQLDISARKILLKYIPAPTAPAITAPTHTNPLRVLTSFSQHSSALVVIINIDSQ